jgi:hypothetical protein
MPLGDYGEYLTKLNIVQALVLAAIGVIIALAAYRFLQAAIDDILQTLPQLGERFTRANRNRHAASGPEWVCRDCRTRPGATAAAARATARRTCGSTSARRSRTTTSVAASTPDPPRVGGTAGEINHRSIDRRFRAARTPARDRAADRSCAGGPPPRRRPVARARGRAGGRPTGGGLVLRAARR